MRDQLPARCLGNATWAKARFVAPFNCPMRTSLVNVTRGRFFHYPDAFRITLP